MPEGQQELKEMDGQNKLEQNELEQVKELEVAFEDKQTGKVQSNSIFSCFTI